MGNILEVLDVQTWLLKSQPPKLVINANGSVGSSGWSDGRLEPRYYIDFPQDGIQDFDFVATPPASIALQVVLPISAHTVWENLPTKVKGVRVHSSSNAVESRIGTAKEITL